MKQSGWSRVWPRRLMPWALSLLCGCGGPAATGNDAGADAFVVGERDAASIDAGSPEDAARPDLDVGLDVDGGAATDASADTGRILPDRDAGDPFGDAGPEGPPAWVPLEVLTDGSHCDALVACGGDEVGTWDVSGGCFEVAVPDTLMMCPGATVSAVGMARGRVTFTGTTGRRTAQSEVVATVFIPGFCASIAGGCPAIESLLRMSVPDSACGADAAGACHCELRQDYVIDDGDAYSIEGSQIVSATVGKRWDYCVSGSSLRYRDVSTSGMIEPGIIELTAH